jgi:3-hydroxyisobutyrate dehydrogenase-like beta-hydroxyacid dehydrogenase
LILSIVPSDRAAAVARTVSATASDTGSVFVDCNPLRPAEARDMAAMLNGAGFAFVDAAIVGAAPARGKQGGQLLPRFHACGADTEALARLERTGLDVLRVDGPVGSASALKLAIAGMSKGMTGLISAMGALAMREGVGDAFLAQLGATQPGLIDWARRQLPTMHDRAARWSVEMAELAALLAGKATQADVFKAFEAFYANAARAGPAPEEQALIGALGESDHR